ncbi:DNA cytosine methyltransferase [Streptomyces sp. CA-253872]|uniref:DNA cytosine methyltransferase n=1 Tax=Streptomyces sp. CA-253872 TaxID=3240067 RepID=UPI003D91E01E
MYEIRALPWNGFTAVSTFSGCGGSSLGYRMAGFRMRWASEFIPAAQDTYRANAAPYTVLDTRDIRDVTAQDITTATGLAAGEIDLYDGSPPCAAFSLAGKREAGWGKPKPYSDTVQRVDDLFFEYARLLKDLQPRTFVAENVAGLVKGAAKGYFVQILAALKACGYRVEARVLDASRLGVPQTRTRLIFVGVREDLATAPAFPRPLPYHYTIRDAFPDASDPRADDETHTDPETGKSITIRPYAIGREWDTLQPGAKSTRYQSLARPSIDKPYPAILQRAGGISVASPTHWHEPRKLTLSELRHIGGFPPDFALTGTYEQRWERIGRAVPPLMMSHIAATIRDRILTPLRAQGAI